MGIFSGICNIAVGFLKNFIGDGFLESIKDIFKARAIQMMDAVMKKLQNKIAEKILGTAHSYHLENGQWMEKAKNYTVDSEIGEWNEIVVSKRRELEQIPHRYREYSDEINDTREIQKEMEMVYGY